jgi:hypothetical protein
MPLIAASAFQWNGDLQATAHACMHSAAVFTERAECHACSDHSDRTAASVALSAILRMAESGCARSGLFGRTGVALHSVWVVREGSPAPDGARASVEHHDSAGYILGDVDVGAQLRSMLLRMPRKDT